MKGLAAGGDSWEICWVVKRGATRYVLNLGGWFGLLDEVVTCLYVCSRLIMEF
jgi:hypothetical protein